MRYCVLMLLAFLASCGPTEEPALRLVTIVDSPDAGLSLRELPPQVLKSVGLSYGLAVVKAGGLAERAGLKIGDVVYGINQRRVSNLEEFNRLLAEQVGGRLALLVRRGRSDFYVAVDLAGGGMPNGGMPKGGPSSKETLLRT